MNMYTIQVPKTYSVLEKTKLEAKVVVNYLKKNYPKKYFEMNCFYVISERMEKNEIEILLKKTPFLKEFMQECIEYMELEEEKISLLLNQTNQIEDFISVYYNYVGHKKIKIAIRFSEENKTVNELKKHIEKEIEQFIQS